MRSATASAKGAMFGAVSGTIASGPASPAPMSVAPSTMPPLAYQSTEICGSPPLSQSSGFAEPLMLKCGSGICGHWNLKLKKPFIASIAFLTMFLAVSIGFWMAVFIASNALCTTPTRSARPWMMVEMVPTASTTMPEMMGHTVPNTPSMAPMAAPMMVCIAGMASPMYAAICDTTGITWSAMPLTNGSTVPLTKSMMPDNAPVISAPRLSPSRFDTSVPMRGATLDTTALKLSNSCAPSAPKSAFSSNMPVRKFCHADFAMLMEPLNVDMDSLAVLPSSPISSTPLSSMSEMASWYSAIGTSVSDLYSSDR